MSEQGGTTPSEASCDVGNGWTVAAMSGVEGQSCPLLSPTQFEVLHKPSGLDACAIAEFVCARANIAFQEGEGAGSPVRWVSVRREDRAAARNAMTLAVQLAELTKGDDSWQAMFSAYYLAQAQLARNRA